MVLSALPAGTAGARVQIGAILVYRWVGAGPCGDRRTVESISCDRQRSFHDVFLSHGDVVPARCLCLRHGRLFLYEPNLCPALDAAGGICLRTADDGHEFLAGSW